MTQEASSKRNNIISAIAVLLLIGTGIYLTVQMGRNSWLTDELKNEKLNAESLLSQKLALDKEISKIKADLQESESKSRDLNKQLNETSEKILAAERDLKKSQNQSSTIAQLKKQQKELLLQKEELDRHVTDYKNSLTQLQSSNDDLQQAVNHLQKQNKDLTDELNAVRLTSMNEILTESSTKKNKLTVKAKRTRNLSVNIDLPSIVQNLNFKLIDPSGKELTEKEGTMAIKTVTEQKSRPQAFYVAEGSSVPSMAYNRMQLSYLAKEKLVPGIYKIEILSNSLPIGSLQVKLR